MSAILLAAVFCAAPSPWRALSPGLELGEFKMGALSSHGDSTATVLRIDPKRWRLSLESAKREGLPSGIAAPRWASLKDLTAVVNAGMFDLEDARSPVGYARVDRVELKSKANRYQGYLVAEPTEPGLAPVRILDVAADDVKSLLPKYRIVLQGLLMVNAKGQNAWPPRQRKWSAVVFALDAQGRMLWIHCRSPYEPHTFIELLRRLPLDVARMVYMEGGPEASLWARAGGETIERTGSYETDFNENDDNRRFWDIPNVFGIRPSAPAAAP